MSSSRNKRSTFEGDFQSAKVALLLAEMDEQIRRIEKTKKKPEEICLQLNICQVLSEKSQKFAEQKEVVHLRNLLQQSE